VAGAADAGGGGDGESSQAGRPHTASADSGFRPGHPGSGSRGRRGGHRGAGAAAERAAASRGGGPPEEAPDPVLQRLLLAAEAPDASLVALDAAAHALLVRERFEEADALVQGTLEAFPQDAESVIHWAVLRGVAGETAAARAELERLAAGPAGWEALLFSAGFALREGDEVAALRALQRFVATAPPGEVTPALRGEVARLQARAGPVDAKKSP